MSDMQGVSEYFNKNLANVPQSLLLTDFAIGDRIEISSATDAWMAGDRFGTVSAIGRFYVHAKMDRSGKTRKMVPENIHRKVFP